MNVFTIPPGTPFLDALARGALARWPDRERLARACVLVPSAAIAADLARAWARCGGPPGAEIWPVGDPAEAAAWCADVPELAADLPPLLAPMRRRLLLARLVAQWSGAETTGEAIGLGPAVRLADSLMRLIDELQAQRLDLSALADFVPDRFAAHRRVTLDFLAVLREHWPRILSAEGAVEPVERHNLLLDRLARSLSQARPGAPVIAAGFADAGAALADLLTAVRDLPDGAVVLPGVDRDLDEAVWAGLGPTHPQFLPRRLLRRIGVDRSDVAPWPVPGLAEAPAGRLRLIAEVLRPAETTDAWADALRALAPDAETALAGIARLDAPGPRDAAAAIALMLRAGLAAPNGTAALVTPDRVLARRVAAELRRWDIAVAPAGWAPLRDMPEALFLRLLARAVAAEFAPVPLLALLKHPCAGGGAAQPAFRAAVRRLDLALRGPRPAPGLTGMIDRLADEGADEALVAWFDGVAGGLRRFADLAVAGADLGDLVAAHRAAAVALAGGETDVTAAFLDALGTAAPGIGHLDGPGYAAFFEAMIEDTVGNSGPAPGAARLFVWDIEAARLGHADLTVLAGLDEGMWPEAARADPWLNRPMRLALGLPAPEEAIGRAAAVFGHAACAPRAIFVRTRKSDGAPTVPSRWLVRLQTLVRGLGLEHRLDPTDDWLGQVERLDAAPAYAPEPPPRPAPPAASRPTRLSTGEVETLLRDPYAVYARRVLDLKPLDRLDADPGAAERGQIVHLALERFVRDHPGGLPADALDRLVAEGRALFDAPAVPPAVAAFWSPRFGRMARWFLDVFEADARRHGLPVALGAGGARTFSLPSGDFMLTAKIDRIDRAADGTLALYDYTTGRVPGVDEAKAGFSPRFLLTALVAAADGFPGVPSGAVGALTHVRLRGGDPAGTVEPVDDLAARLQRTEAGFMRLLARFADPATPYIARPVPDGWPGPYDHLARRGEWGISADGED